MSSFYLWQTGNHPSFRGEKVKSVVSKLTELRRFPNCQFTSQSYYAKMLQPDYYKLLLEIEVGRRFWQSNPSAENGHAFHVRVVKPLRQLQRRGVVERLREIAATDDITAIAVEIIGPVDLTKLSKQ
jgi:hypothetical protein